MRGTLLLTTLGLAQVAHAVDVDPFDPSASIPHDSGTPAVESPALTGGGPSAGIMANVAEDLVTRTNADGELERTVPHVFSSTLYGGWTFEDRLRIDVLAPIYWHTRSQVEGEDPFSGAALGDLVVQSNIRLKQNESGTFGLSLLPAVGLPTGRRKALVARGVHLKLKAAVGGEFNDRFGYAANLGFVLGPGSEFVDVAVGSSFNAKAGVWVRLQDRFRVGADYDTSIGTSNAPGARNVLGTGHIFAQATNDSGFGLTVGAGRGFLVGVGAPRYRVFGALSYAQLVRDSDDDTIIDSEDACPLDPEDFDGFEDVEGCPDVDNDEDGILDVDDTCPDQAEDFDDFEDIDGCPDEDNDQDGLLDEVDACMHQAGPAELAGCPDMDGDGLADLSPTEGWEGWEAVTEGGYTGPIPLVTDQCPADPGLEAFAGCPDTDSDQVPDYRDACPDVPRLEDEPAENSNGCPRKAFVRGDRIEITERVLFETGRAVIRPESYEVLDSVVDALDRYPQIKQIEVAGHTDNVGGDNFNMGLSRRRAASVMEYLTGKGIAAERLSSKGYGETEPIAVNFTEAGRQKNRRVEFRILEQEPFTEEVETDLGKDLGGITVKLPMPYATLQVDGEPVSPQAPVRNLLVEPGGHMVHVTDPRRGLDFSTGVDVTAGSTVIVEIPPEQLGPISDVVTPDMLQGMPERQVSDAPVPVPDDAPLAVPVDGAQGEPAEGEGTDASEAPDATEGESPDATESPDAMQGEGDAGDSGDSAMDLLPTADQPDVPDDADLLPKADVADDDPDGFPVETEGGVEAEPVEAGSDDPWGAGGDAGGEDGDMGVGPDAAETSDGLDAPDGSAPTLGQPTDEVITGPGFGGAGGSESGPGFGAVEEDPKEARKRARREAREARRAARRARKEAKKAEKEAKKNGDDAPPPLVDPSTLPGAEGQAEDTDAPAEPEAPADAEPEADDAPPADDPWSQD